MVNNNFAIILARGGSKTIPNKNIKPLNNTNCVELTIKSLLNVFPPENILLSSDSKDILNIGQKSNIMLLKRPKELSSDLASSESAWLHAIYYLKDINIYPTTIIAPQVTSPLRYQDTLKKALKSFNQGKYDSLFSATEVSDHTFEWTVSKESDEIKAINYDPYKPRVRRQDQISKMKIKENGSFFIFKTEGFLKNKNRLFGNIGYYMQDKLESIEIDERQDWVIAEAVLSNNKNLFIY